MSAHLFSRPTADTRTVAKTELDAAVVDAGMWRWTAERLAAALLADGDTASVAAQRRAALAAYDRMQEGAIQ